MEMKLELELEMGIPACELRISRVVMGLLHTQRHRDTLEKIEENSIWWFKTHWMGAIFGWLANLNLHKGLGFTNWVKLQVTVWGPLL